MNGQGGSYIIQPDGEKLQVEGPNMTDAERAAAAEKAAVIIADAEAKAKADADPASKSPGAETAINQGATAKGGRRQQSEE